MRYARRRLFRRRIRRVRKYGFPKRRRFVARRRFRRQRRINNRPEEKTYTQVAYPINYVSTFGTVNLTGLIIKGTDFGQRIGSSIVIRRIQFLLTCGARAATGIVKEYTRFSLFRQLPFISGPTAYNQLYDVDLIGGTDGIAEQGNWMPGNPNWKRIKTTRMVNLKPGDPASTPGTLYHTKRITVRFRKGLRVQYQDTGVAATDRRSNYLYLQYMGQQAAEATACTGTLAFRIWFTDV